MTRDDFATRLSAALALPDPAARRDALEPLVGYGEASDLARLAPPVACSCCGYETPRRFVIDGLCVDCRKPQSAAPF